MQSAITCSVKESRTVVIHSIVRKAADSRLGTDKETSDGPADRPISVAESTLPYTYVPESEGGFVNNRAFQQRRSKDLTWTDQYMCDGMADRFLTISDSNHLQIWKR